MARTKEPPHRLERPARSALCFSPRSVNLGLLRFIGLVHKYIVAPDLDAFHADERAFEQGTGEQYGMLVAETLRNEETIPRAAVIEQIKSIRHARAHGLLQGNRANAPFGGQCAYFPCPLLRCRE